MQSILILTCLVGQADYFPMRSTYVYSSTGPYGMAVRPMPYFYFYSTSRTYKNKRRHVPPDHRKKRLEWERSRISEKGRHEQLKRAVRQIWQREEEHHELLSFAIENLDDYDTLKEEVRRFKYYRRKGDPNWGKSLTHY